MSAGPGFFQSEAVRALLARASRAAGVPLAVHYLSNGQEGPLVIGFGGCAACKYVAGLSGGKTACRASRCKVSWSSLRQGSAVAGVCHMGFGLLSLPALRNETYAITLGPFVPNDAGNAIEYDALQGLADLCGELPASFPVTLDDIHRAAAGSLPAMAEWLTEELERLWTATAAQQTITPPETSPILGNAATRRNIRPISPAAALATAIAGGHGKRVRALLLAEAKESRPRRRGEKSQSGTHVLALLTETLAVCAKAGIDTDEAMKLLPEAAVALGKAVTPEEATARAFKAVAVLLRPQPGALRDYRGLDRLLAARLPERLTLAEAAEALGKSPAAISLHLQRRFGMNYSEYQACHRMERAQELLRRTQLSATAIAVRVGIDDVSNFAKLFRRHTGLSPLQYRARFADPPNVAPRRPRKKNP